MAISHPELSDNEGPLSFVPIVPSLNKKPVRDAPRSDGDHFRCNTFAELQQRMDCIYSSTEGKIGTQTGTLKSTKPTSTRKSSQGFLESTKTVCINNPDWEHSKFSSAISFEDASPRANEEKLSAHLCQSCGMKPTATYSQDSELVLQEKLHLRGDVPKLLASPSSPKTSRAAAQPEQAVSWTPPAGMTQGLRQDQQVGSLQTERVPSRCLVEVSSLQATVLENCSDRGFLRTTVTFQQPIDLNGEDELVFTVVEELPCGLIPENSCPSNLLSFNTDCSPQTLSASSQPVSIIGSINDDYDVYTAQGAAGTAADAAANHKEILFSQYGHVRSAELDRSHTSSNNPTDTKCPASHSSSLNTSLSAQVSLPAAHPTVPQKTVGCCRQGGSDPREVELLSASKPPRNGMSVSTKWPPKASSSSQRVVDCCERTSSWRRHTLIKLPKITQCAETLGTVSSRPNSRSKWGPMGNLVTGTLKFSSSGRKSNGQKNIMSSKSGNFCTPSAPLVTQLMQEPPTTTQSQSAFKTSHSTGSSTSSEEEFNPIPADSFTHRSSSVKTEHSSARMSSSLKSRRVKAEPYKYYGSRLSLKRCDSQMLPGKKTELLRENQVATLGGNIRLAPRHKAPSSTTTAESASQHSPGDFATTVKVLGQVKGQGSQVPASDGPKVRTLLTCSTKSQSSSPKPVSSLLPTGQSLVQLKTRAKMGRGRTAISQVTEFADVSQREQLSRAPGVKENDATESRKCSVSRSQINMVLPSPYSKITAPRRPEHYSGRHGSDNGSMGRTALFYRSGGSSGYESMIQDSETTGSTSSAHDSMSGSGESSSVESRVSKSPKKRGHGECPPPPMYSTPLQYLYNPQSVTTPASPVLPGYLSFYQYCTIISDLWNHFLWFKCFMHLTLIRFPVAPSPPRCLLTRGSVGGPAAAWLHPEGAL